MVPVEIPVSLQTCRDFPSKPTSTKQSAGGKYLVAVAGVAIDCKTKLGAVVDLTNRHNSEVEKINSKKPD